MPVFFSVSLLSYLNLLCGNDLTPWTCSRNKKTRSWISKVSSNSLFSMFQLNKTHHEDKPKTLRMDIAIVTQISNNYPVHWFPGEKTCWFCWSCRSICLKWCTAARGRCNKGNQLLQMASTTQEKYTCAATNSRWMIKIPHVFNFLMQCLRILVQSQCDNDVLYDV